MNLVKNLLFIFMIISLFSCGSFVPTVNIKALPVEVQHKVNSIEIYNQGQLLNKNFKVVSIIEGHSCQNKLWDPPATRAGAIEQLKYEAYELNVDGITNVNCSGKEGTSTRTNCWELVSCTAEAIKLSK